MGRWGLGAVIRGREGLPGSHGFIQTSPQMLWLLSCTDPEGSTKRKVQGKGCPGGEAPHRKLSGQGSAVDKQSLSPIQASLGIPRWTPS